MPVFEILNNEMQRIKSKAPPSFKAQVVDTEKRLSILFDHLNNQEVIQPSTIEELKQVAQQVQSREHDQAATAVANMISGKANEGTNWMVSSCFESELVAATDYGCRLVLRG
jgi:protein transport protein SEC31